ncbi:MAG: AbrB/MazE/SpoVT family DNA-binding domain-containing protein [Candidatus Bathyarchaeia archaeon]
MPKLRSEMRSYCVLYTVSIHHSLIEELGWREGDILEWRRDGEGLKLFLVRRAEKPEDGQGQRLIPTRSRDREDR